MSSAPETDLMEITPTIIGRPPVPDDKHTVTFSCRLSPDVLIRMKAICFRRSIHNQKLYSEGTFLTESIMKASMPRPPSEERVQEFLAKNPVSRNMVTGTWGDNQTMWTCCLKPHVRERMKTVCFRRSVHRMRPLAENAFVTAQIINAELPSPPQAARVEAYILKFPKKRSKFTELAALTPKRLSRKRA